MSRKYKQSGYQDEERPSTRRPRSGAPRERPEGPRGRGLGAPESTVFRCGQCGRKQPAATVAPGALCGGCQADLHTCKHCTHFDPSAPLECRQPIPRRVSPKTVRNECELFEVKWTQEFAAEAESPESRTPRDAKAAFDDLFDF